MKRLFFLVFLLFFLSGPAQATTTIDFQDRYQDYNGIWHTYTNENLARHPMYSTSENESYYYFTTLGKTIAIHKSQNVTLYNDRFSPSMTFPKTELESRTVNINLTHAYLKFPYYLSGKKDSGDVHNIKFGRWKFDNSMSVVDSTSKQLSRNYYDFDIVDDEMRLYYLKSEMNKMSGDITFQTDTWIIDNATTSGFTVNNISMSNLRFTGDGLIALNIDTQYRTNLSCYWSMDETQGTIVRGINGTGNGIPDSACQGTWNGYTSINSTQGGVGTAISFDGSDDYIDLAEAGNVTGNALTISTQLNWNKFYSDTSGHPPISRSDIAASGYLVYQSSGDPYNRVRFFVVNTTGILKLVTSTTTLNINQLYRYTAQYNGSFLSQFFNVVQDASTSSHSGNVKKSVNSLYLGSVYTPAGAKYNGSIDELGIWNGTTPDTNVSFSLNGSINMWNNTAMNGNVINRTRIVYTGQSGVLNASVYIRQNGALSWLLIKSNATNNTWYNIPTAYQHKNMDFNVTLQGNGTDTPFFQSLEWDETPIPQPPHVVDCGYNFTNLYPSIRNEDIVYWNNQTYPRYLTFVVSEETYTPDDYSNLQFFLNNVLFYNDYYQPTENYSERTFSFNVVVMPYSNYSVRIVTDPYDAISSIVWYEHGLCRPILYPTEDFTPASIAVILALAALVLVKRRKRN